MKLCLVGLGIIGSAWAPHYRKAGYDLSLWNRTPKNLEGFHKDLQEAARDAEIIHIVVADPPAVASVLDQLKEIIRPQTLVIQSSTISSDWGVKFSRQVQSFGAIYVEAPFTGSKIAAEEGANVFYLGGIDEARQRAKEVLTPVAKKCYDIGTVEQACGMKLAMNVQVALISQALNEGLTMARHYGVKDELFFEVLSQNVSQSGVATLKQSKLIAKDYAPQFSIKHMHKDLCLAIDSVGENMLPVTSRNVEVYAKGIHEGMQDDDFSALIELLSNSST